MLIRDGKHKFVLMRDRALPCKCMPSFFKTLHLTFVFSAQTLRIISPSISEVQLMNMALSFERQAFDGASSKVLKKKIQLILYLPVIE